tara:strand:- start:2905 stop:3633 length:729 start_codon:yes stop_codon:yes gene_type:complete
MGTGVLFNRDGRSYVLTAAHVLSSVIKAQKFKTDYVITMTREIYDKAGIQLGSTTLKVDLLKYNTKLDLAVLFLNPKLSLKSSTKFHVSKTIPKVGTEIWHVGSPYGDKLALSVFDGVISYLDRKIPFAPVVKDQANIHVIPGCSGGGVFLKDDLRCIGIMVISVIHQALFVPIRQIIKWAKKEKIYYLFDPIARKPKLKTKLEAKKKSSVGPEDVLPFDLHGHKFYGVPPKIKPKKKAKLY